MTTTDTAQHHKLIPLLGPAFVAAVAYVDPGNVAANITAGARYGYLLVWVLVASNIFAMVIQYLSAKLGLVTGRSLPALLGDRMSKPGRIAFWIQAEIVAAATDLAEVIGGALALHLLFGISLLWGGVIIGAVSMALLVVQGEGKQRQFETIIVGLLVDRRGFPLQVGCWEGNKAETTTIIPVVEAFQAAHGIEDLIIVADASMLSAANLTTLDDARLRFIVGARTTRAPGDLEAHFHWAGDAFTDGQLIDTITPKRGSRSQRDVSKRREPVWDPDTHPGSWRAVWAYSKKRAARDNQTLTAQANRARAILAGEKRPKGTRFVTVHQGDQVLDEASIARARSLVGLKGYVTNIPSRLMGAGEVVSSYHELWHVEQSFRMSKHDLRARPVFHHTRDAIEAHLTVVMAALAVARHLQETTGISIKRIIRALKPLQDVTINLNGHHLTAADPLTPEAEEILTALSIPTGH